MVNLGVAAKQKDKARQAFSRSEKKRYSSPTEIQNSSIRFLDRVRLKNRKMEMCRLLLPPRCGKAVAAGLVLEAAEET